MRIQNTPLQGCFIIEPTIHTDARGYFYESFSKKKWTNITGLNIDFVQDNIAQSDYGVLRGLHLQTGAHAQAKLVTVLQGSVLDVALDLRPESNTYLQHFSVKLTQHNHLQFFIPTGFAHGYIVLQPNTLFYYKCSNYYHKPAEAGIHPLDKTLNIDWLLNETDYILSEKDNQLPTLEKYGKQ